MAKFVANLETTMSVSGMRFVPIMVEAEGQKTPLVLVRRAVGDDNGLGESVITMILDQLNRMLDDTVPFSDEEKPKVGGELLWKQDGMMFRAQHPYADKAAYYVRPTPDAAFIATIVDGESQDVRVIGRSESAQNCFELCEEQLQRYKSTLT